MVSIRYGIGLRPMAAIVALRDAGVINRKRKHLIDKNIVQRAQEKLMNDLDEEFILTFKEKGISFILFDGHIRNVMIEAEGSNQAHIYTAQIKEIKVLSVNIKVNIYFTLHHQQRQ